MTRAIVAALALLVINQSARPANVAVVPVRVSLSATQDKQVISVRNQGTETVAMQVDTVAWSQVDGADQYTPTRELLINPPLFRIAPGKEQLLRVGLRSRAAGPSESAYRIFLREIPTQWASSSDAGGGAVRVMLELRLPVYVQPEHVVDAQQWRASLKPDGTVSVVLDNTGNVHQVVSSLSLLEADGGSDAAALVQASPNVAVLAGQTARWNLRPNPPVSGDHLRLAVTDNRGIRHVVVPLGRE